MKILFSIEGCGGGTAASFVAVASLLESDGHVVRIVLSSAKGNRTPDNVEIPWRYVLGMTPEIGIRFRRLLRPWLLLNCLFRWKFYFLKCRRLPRFDYDCYVMFHGQEMAWRWLHSKPSVMWIHDIWGGAPSSVVPNGMTRRLVLWSKRKAALGFNHHVAVTSQSADAFRKVYRTTKRPLVINNLFDIGKIDSLSKEGQTDIRNGPSPNLLYVGRLTGEKGVDRLLEAVKNIHLDGIPFRLWIVGGSFDAPASGLESVVKEMKLEAAVRVLGPRKNPFPFMRAADLLVLPSKAEGMGMVLWEALLCGTPVLATDCGGTREALREGAWGILVDNSTAGIEAGIRRFLTSREAPDPAIARAGIVAANERNRATVLSLFRQLDSRKNRN